MFHFIERNISLSTQKTPSAIISISTQKRPTAIIGILKGNF